MSKGKVIMLGRGRSSVDQVQALFGRGPFLSLGPGPDSVPHRCLRALVGGPGPALKSRPRPKIA